MEDEKKDRCSIFHNNDCDDDNDDDNDEDAPMDVSLAALKRQVMGRDLVVDDYNDDEDDNEGNDNSNDNDEEDCEIRQIRLLMNAYPATSNNDKKSDEKEEIETETNNDETMDDGVDDDDDGGGDRETTNAKTKSTTNTTAAAAAATSSLSLSLSLPEKLRKDLMCTICHEVVYPPVALPCGHSFCRPCIEWWFEKALDRYGSCPTCRKRFPAMKKTNSRSNPAFLPNLALKACVTALFGPEIIERILHRKKIENQTNAHANSTRGERGGAHMAGYRVLSSLEGETWHYVAVGGGNIDCGANTNVNTNRATIQVRRNIVLDAEDQCMQLALAVYRKPTKETATRVMGNGNSNSNSTNNHRGGCFRVELCLLQMEEDEASDSGFATNIISPEDELFVVGSSSRFAYTTLTVQTKDENGRLSPLARVSSDPGDGRFKYRWMDNDATMDNNGRGDSDNGDNDSDNGDRYNRQRSGGSSTIRALVFEHCETGTQLEIDLAQLQNRAGGSTLLPPPNATATATGRGPGRKRAHDDDYDRDSDCNSENNNNLTRRRYHEIEEEEDNRYIYNDDSDDEDAENQDEFEEDGFVVGDDDDNDNVDVDDDDDDACCICNDGDGELMVCDGGDDNPGCFKSFHAACVHRSVVPDGDWICQACAVAAGMVGAGIAGHEYEPEPTTTSTGTNNAGGGDSDASIVNANACATDDEMSDAEGAAFSSDEEKEKKDDDDEDNDNDEDNDTNNDAGDDGESKASQEIDDGSDSQREELDCVDDDDVDVDGREREAKTIVGEWKRSEHNKTALCPRRQQRQ